MRSSGDPPREPRLMRGGDEIDDEIRFYIEERTREFEARGLDPEAARAAALEAFGDPAGVARQVRRVRGDTGGRGRWGTMLGRLRSDIRFAIRTLGRAPAFTVAAVATLALGLGATTAIFSVIEGVFLRKPPVRDPGSLVAVYTTCRRGDPHCSSSYPDYLDYRERSTTIEDLAGWSWLPLNLGDAGEPPVRLTGMLVTGNYFDLLGVPARAGRLLQPGDEDPAGPAAVVVLSHDTWVRRFGGSYDVVGSTVRLAGVPFQVVGVTPEGFRGTSLTSAPDVFLTMAGGSLLGVGSVAVEGVFQDRGTRWMEALVGRLRPGATVEQLASETASLAASLNQLYPEERGDRRITVEPSSRYTLPQFGREDLQRLIAILGTVVGLALALGVANVANLSLARASVREREMAIRVSLGATGGSLTRQVLVESVLVAAIGGAVGLGVAAGVLRLLAAYQLPGGVSTAFLGVGLRAPVLLATGLLTGLTGVVFGLAPAWKAGRREPAALLRGEDRGRRGSRMRGVLVGVQVGLCLVLLVGAGLFLRTLRNGFGYDGGFDPGGVALLRFDLSGLQLTPDEGIATVDALLERVRALPGVEAAAVATKVPLQVGGNRGSLFEVPGYVPADGEELRLELAGVTSDFARVFAMPVLAGAGVSARGSLEPPRVIVSAGMAERYWRDEAAVGERLTLGRNDYEVGGVVANAAWRSIPQPPLNFVLFPLHHEPPTSVSMPLTVAVRTGGSAATALDPLHAALREVRPDAAVHSLQTMEDLLGATLSAQRLGSLLLTSLSVLALLLAAVGIGGVVAFSVGQRRREIGVRVALGASRGRVLGTIGLGVSRPVVIGGLVGLLLARVMAGALGAFLVDVEPGDTLTYVTIAALVALVAALAAVLPAHRATSVKPREVLSSE